MMRQIRYSGIGLIFIFLYFVYKTYKRTQVFPFELSALSVCIFVLTVLFLYFLVDTLLLLPGALKKITVCILFFLYTFLGSYHYKVSQYFDFSIIADHWRSVWRPGSFFETLTVANNIFGDADYCRMFMAIIIGYGLVRWDLKRNVGVKKTSVVVSAVSFSLLLVLAPNPVDEIGSLAKSFGFRVFSIKKSFQQKYMPQVKDELPLVWHFEASRGAETAPNIFFVFVESVNARFIESKSPEGIEFTPFINSLIPKGAYFERFYAQSIQTGRAHFSSLCGLTNSVYGKEFEKFVDRKLNCLPEILRSNGYETIFSKANEDIHFDNTYEFTTTHGFNVMNTMGKGCKGEDKGLCWGWGIPDDIFFKRFFAYLKQNHTSGKPLFAALATISSHMPFNEVPEDQRYIYKHPSNRFEYYSNALRVSDEYLKVFFSELARSPYAKNSIVFLMGDHSFPMGEHKNFHNETFAFEENFRTPLVILDYRTKKVVQPKRVKEAYSQINLPATVLDLAGISADVHFQGGSLLSEAPSYIHLIQPYGGIYFSVIKYPFKYVMYDRSEKEYIYNLSEDPNEHYNLIDTWEDKEMLEEFRHEVGKIWLNFELMKEDRVWRN